MKEFIGFVLGMLFLIFVIVHFDELNAFVTALLQWRPE